MEIYLINTPVGLIPETDDDYEGKKKLKVGATYKAEVKLSRNPLFHRKYFAMIAASWEFLDEKQTVAFKSKEGFRKYVEVAAGYFDLFYSPKQEEFVEIPKSISFGSMDNAEFTELYDKVKNVIWTLIGERVTREQYERVLMNF